MNVQSLASRIRRLEAQRRRKVCDQPRLPVLVIGGVRRDRQLLEGERKVLDLFRDTGALIWAVERVTTDPVDNGRRCEPGGCLPDVLANIHGRCPFREKYGECRICLGMPVADSIAVPVDSKKDNS